MLDIDCLQFSYSAIAAAALHHMVSPSLASAVSGYKTVDLGGCVEWMAPFATVVKEDVKESVPSSGKPGHEIQVHHVNLQLVVRQSTFSRESTM